jgi:hypothetical protein
MAGGVDESLCAQIHLSGVVTYTGCDKQWNRHYRKDDTNAWDIYSGIKETDNFWKSYVFSKEVADMWYVPGRLYFVCVRCIFCACVWWWQTHSSLQLYM